MKDIIMPELEDGEDVAVVGYWHFEEGDPVEEGDDLVAVNTSSGTLQIAAPVSGVLHEVYFDEGDEIEEGDVLGCIEEEEAEERDTQDLEDIEDVDDYEDDDQFEDMDADEDSDDKK